MFAGRLKNCKSPVLQDKCNIEIFLSPAFAPCRFLQLYHVYIHVAVCLFMLPYVFLCGYVYDE